MSSARFTPRASSRSCSPETLLIAAGRRKGSASILVAVTTTSRTGAGSSPHAGAAAPVIATRHHSEETARSFILPIPSATAPYGARMLTRALQRSVHDFHDFAHLRQRCLNIPAPAHSHSDSRSPPATRPTPDRLQYTPHLPGCPGPPPYNLRPRPDAAYRARIVHLPAPPDQASIADGYVAHSRLAEYRARSPPRQ